MRLRARIVVGLLALGSCLVLALPSFGQIASYVNREGNVVFINGDSGKGSGGSTISSPPGGTGNGAQAPSGGKKDAKGPKIGMPSKAGKPSTEMEEIVQAAAQRHKLDPALVKAVIGTESSWNPYAVSRKGAMGLMQLVPATAERFGVGNPYDPVQNVEGGASYLRLLLDHYDGDLTKSLAAYNAGERVVDAYGGVPRFPETRMYVQKVTNAYFGSDAGSGDTSIPASPRKEHLRREVESNGRVVYTNQ